MFRSIALTMLLITAPFAAQAHMCPAMMAEIDAAMPTAMLSDDVRARVLELRAEGEALHNAGDHSGSVAALEEAKALLDL
ncbi:MAG: hypothetical protein ACK4LQ_13915 [Pararhodobacter sp.]